MRMKKYHLFCVMFATVQVKQSENNYLEERLDKYLLTTNILFTSLND